MNKLFNRKIHLFFLSFVLLSFSSNAASAQATEIYFSKSSGEIRAGDTFIVEAWVSSPSEPVNVIDGSIFFNKGRVAVKEISTGGSVFSLWAREPAFSNDNGSITFVGGAPNGYSGQKGLIFRLILEARTEGEAELKFSEGVVLFAQDGNGTRVEPSSVGINLTILPSLEGVAVRDEWGELVSQDTTPPVFVEAIVARSRDIFENKYFVSFFAIDDGSGISHYEVKEGDGNFIRADSPYVLEDQSLGEIIVVKAFDVAGNTAETNPEFAPEASFFGSIYLWLLGILILLITIWLSFRRKASDGSI